MPLRQIAHRLVLLAAALFTPVFCGADIYKWTDADGRVHFGDKPKDRAIQAQPVEVNDYKPGSDADTRAIVERRQRLMDADADEKKRPAKNAATARQRAEENCVAMREQLLRISGRVAFYGDDGKLLRVSEQERAAMHRELQGRIAEQCP